MKKMLSECGFEKITRVDGIKAENKELLV